MGRVVGREIRAWKWKWWRHAEGSRLWVVAGASAGGIPIAVVESRVGWGRIERWGIAVAG